MSLSDSERGGDGWYIILAADGYHDKPNVGSPIRADSPEHAVSKRGMMGYEKIKVYPVKEKPTGDCEYWDGDDLDFE